MKLNEAQKTVPKNDGGIYVISCVNGKVYIGQAKNFRQRIRTHLNCLRGGTSKNPPMQAAWNKYGEDGFTFQVLETVAVDRVQLCEAENKWMATYRDLAVVLFNVCLIAESPLGKKLSDQQRQRISEYTRGRKLSEEHRRRIGESKIGNQIMRGRKLTDEWKQNIGKNSHFRHLTPEQQRRKGMSRRRRYGFVSPDSRIVVIRGLKDWCEYNNLHLGAMVGVYQGKLNHHQGWRKAA